MKRVFYAAVPALVLFSTISCSQPLQNGVYGARYAQTDPNGWMHELVLQTQRGRIRTASYLVRNAADAMNDHGAMTVETTDGATRSTTCSPSARC